MSQMDAFCILAREEGMGEAELDVLVETAMEQIEIVRHDDDLCDE